jgi:hypothetical protein
MWRLNDSQRGLLVYGVSCHSRATAAGEQRIECVGDHAVTLRVGVQIDLIFAKQDAAEGGSGHVEHLASDIDERLHRAALD